jgi:hypothetical protein
LMQKMSLVLYLSTAWDLKRENDMKDSDSLA